MNIFYTNTDPYMAADEHCIVHQVKMILEYSQLLSTAHHVTGSGTADMYKATHVNHPSAVWVRESTHNYAWLLKCWGRLLDNFKSRSGKHHAASRMVMDLAKVPDLPAIGMTDIRLAMPDHHRQADPCLAYQSYLNDKFREWLDRPRPMKVEFMYGDPDWLRIERPRTEQ